MIAQGATREASIHKAEELILEDLVDRLQTGNTLPKPGFFQYDITRHYPLSRVAVFELEDR